MNNLVSPDGGSQTLYLSLIRLSSTSFPTLKRFFFHHAAEFTIPLIQLHHGNACHPALCAGEHNLVVWSNCWSLSPSLAWEGKQRWERVGKKEEWGKWNPLGRASTPLTYLDHSDRPLLLSPEVLDWNISHLGVHLLMEVPSRCSLHITICNCSWWNLLEFNVNVESVLRSDLSCLTVFWQRQVDSPTVDHQIHATLMDACFIDAVNLFTNDQPHWLWLLLIAIDD